MILLYYQYFNFVCYVNAKQKHNYYNNIGKLDKINFVFYVDMLSVFSRRFCKTFDYMEIEGFSNFCMYERVELSDCNLPSPNDSQISIR